MSNPNLASNESAAIRATRIAKLLIDECTGILQKMVVEEIKMKYKIPLDQYLDKNETVIENDKQFFWFDIDKLFNKRLKSIPKI